MATTTNDLRGNKKIFRYNNYNGGIAEHIKSILPKNREIVILCIGSEKYTGDLLGPFIGTMLEKANCPYKVYGKLNNTCHALNLVDTIETIKENHENPFIIAIDACGGEKEEVGNIEVYKGGIKAGTVNPQHSLPLIGDLSIVGVTFEDSNKWEPVITSANYGISYKMQEIITAELMTALMENE